MSKGGSKGLRLLLGCTLFEIISKLMLRMGITLES